MGLWNKARAEVRNEMSQRVVESTEGKASPRSLYLGIFAVTRIIFDIFDNFVYGFGPQSLAVLRSDAIGVCSLHFPGLPDVGFLVSRLLPKPFRAAGRYVSDGATRQDWRLNEFQCSRTWPAQRFS